MDRPSNSSTFQNILQWFKALAQNVYFWGGLGILAIVAFVVYFLFNSIIMPSYTRHDVSVAVPDVINQPFEQAQQTLEQQNLEVERQKGRFNPNVPQNQVVDQSPAPDSPVKPGRRVYLTVNSGQVPRVQLPDLTGSSRREASNRIQALGLKVGSVQADPIPSPYPNTITKQEPAPGDSIKQGASVKLWYSRGLGDENAVVPDLRGMQVAEARRVLLNHRLRYVVVEQGSSNDEDDGTMASQEEPDDLDTWYVESQGTTPDASVRAGSEIRLFVTEEEVPRPDEEGGTEGEEANTESDGEDAETDNTDEAPQTS